MALGSKNEQRVESANGNRRSRARRWLLVGAGSICMVCWIAFGLGIVMDVSRSTLIILVTVAAVATEGLFWVVAAVLGVTVFQARRKILNWLLRRPAEDKSAP